ncbi:hypothetical protein L9F63_019451, partial [Diploptera punctata]
RINIFLLSPITFPIINYEDFQALIMLSKTGFNKIYSNIVKLLYTQNFKIQFNPILRFVWLLKTHIPKIMLTIICINLHSMYVIKCKILFILSAYPGFRHILCDILNAVCCECYTALRMSQR